MAINDKARKILWARSGNRCAICKRELVIDETPTDKASIVGEECHIISGKKGGPRYHPIIPDDLLDSYGNLLLLCRVDHKMVDDQQENFSADVLRLMKANHESWVFERLRHQEFFPNPKLKRIKNNISQYLVRVRNGQELRSLVSRTFMMNFGNVLPRNEQEVRLLADFFDEIKDWADLVSGLDPGESIKAEYRISEHLEELETAGFLVFIALEIQILDGAPDGPVDWPVAHIRAIRPENVVASTSSEHESQAEQSPPANAAALRP